MPMLVGVELLLIGRPSDLQRCWKKGEKFTGKQAKLIFHQANDPHAKGRSSKIGENFSLNSMVGELYGMLCRSVNSPFTA